MDEREQVLKEIEEEHRKERADIMDAQPHLLKAMRNPFVEDITKDGNLLYTKDFYVAMWHLLEKGYSATKAYKALGFNVSELGRNRADSAAKRARAIGRKGGFVNASEYDGSVPPEKMPLDTMSVEEQLAYMTARNHYLENYAELQKKIFSSLTEKK